MRTDGNFPNGPSKSSPRVRDAEVTQKEGSLSTGCYYGTGFESFRHCRR